MQGGLATARERETVILAEVLDKAKPPTQSSVQRELQPFQDKESFECGMCGGKQIILHSFSKPNRIRMECKCSHTWVLGGSN